MGCGIATKCIYGDGKTFEGDKTGAISFPIYQTATYAHPEGQAKHRLRLQPFAETYKAAGGECGGYSGRQRRCTPPFLQEWQRLLC